MLRVVALIATASAWPKNCNRPWELRNAAECDIGAQRVTCAASGPHDPTRVAIVFRGEPFRGLTYAVQGIPKHVHACTRHAVAIQRAIGRAHVARLIAPLEKEFAVDVYLAATANPSCKAVQHLPQLYGRHRVVNMTAVPDASRRRSHCVRPRPRGLSACRSSAGISSPPEQQEEMRADDRQAAVRARAGRLWPRVSSRVPPCLGCCAFYRSDLLIVLSCAARAPSASA